MKAFFVRKLGKKNLIFKSSLDASSPNSIVYLAICSTVDSSLSLENLFNDSGVLQPLGTLACRTQSGKADTEYGWLVNPTLNPNLLRTWSTTLVMLCCPPGLLFLTHQTTLLGSWFRSTMFTSPWCSSGLGGSSSCGSSNT